MNSDESYYNYLNRYSLIGGAYRKFFLYKKFNTILQGSILDVGCGLGHYLSFQKGVTGTDVNPILVEACIKKGLDVLQMPIDILPFEDITFDSILLDNVLEHIKFPNPLIRQINRVLKKGGICLVGVPGVKGMAYDLDHKVAYDELSLEVLAHSEGFWIKDFFYMPLCKSNWLSKSLKQYCIYSIWVKK